GQDLLGPPDLLAHLRPQVAGERLAGVVGLVHLHRGKLPERGEEALGWALGQEDALAAANERRRHPHDRPLPGGAPRGNDALLALLACDAVGGRGTDEAGGAAGPAEGG